LSEIPVIKKIEASLTNRGISLVILGIEKDAQFGLSELVGKLMSFNIIQKIKFIVLVDAGLPVQNLDTVVWYVTGNIDPKRDCKIHQATHTGEVTHLVVDGTRKTAHSDGFGRDWPNPVVSSVETIEKIDQMWMELGLGEMISSPSRIYYPLMRGDGAISE
jgi:4-hydroxy-3-polyprenylbenzoate decarboxylase